MNNEKSKILSKRQLSTRTENLIYMKPNSQFLNDSFLICQFSIRIAFLLQFAECHVKDHPSFFENYLDSLVRQQSNLGIKSQFHFASSDLPIACCDLNNKVWQQSLQLLHMDKSTKTLLAAIFLAICILGNAQAYEIEVGATSGNSTNSTNCTTGYTPINGTCVNTNCEAGTYYMNSTGLCGSCSGLGQNCGTLCSGYGYFPTSSPSVPTCKPCSTNYGIGCISCSNTVCTTCSGTLTLATGSQSCVDVTCGISNCAQCAGSASCFLCQPGYIVNTATGLCISSTCSVNFCGLCNGQSCSICTLGYSLTNGGLTCAPQCDSTCNNCLSPGVCSSCIKGYVINTLTMTCAVDCSLGFNGLCSSCSNLLFCTTCIQGYEPAFYGLLCVPIISCTDVNCYQCSASSVSTCLICDTGYTLTNKTCVEDVCSIDNCAACNTSTTCSKCQSNNVLSSDQTECVPSCRSVVSNCLICTDSKTCQICDFGYSLVSVSNATNSSSSNSTITCKPICSIDYCGLCLSATNCGYCLTGYKLSSDLTTCNLQCINHCDVCSTKDTCGTCRSGYTLTSNVCLRSCSQGKVMSNGKCQTCESLFNHCEVCTTTTTCDTCSYGYYITGSGTCNSCSSSLSNCLTCSSPTTCTLCQWGYILNSVGKCVTNTCTASNCIACTTSSTTLCSTCFPGFKNNNGVCQVPTCSGNQVFLSGLGCACPTATFLSGTNCVACTSPLCLSCTSSQCSTCVSGYYPSGSACVLCPTNCQSCTSSTSCQLCASPYSLVDKSCQMVGNGVSGAVSSTGDVYVCDPGCSSCTLGVGNVLICVVVLDGYALAQGKIQKCSTTCKTCASSSPNTCVSCFNGFALQGSTCTACSDSNATACSSSNAAYSTACISGFTPTINSTLGTSTCQACAINCLKCDLNGADKCDSGQCAIGFVVQTGFTNCTQCFSGCPVCDPNNIGTCLSCGIRRFMATDGTCQGCPTGSKSCTSLTVSTDCFVGYLLVNGTCQAAPVYPCTGGTSSYCTKCVAGYTATNGVCTYTASCNSTSTCTFCPYGYYMNNGACPACPILTGCLSCNPNDATSCFLCNKGYYLDAGVCKSCKTGCSSCSSQSSCLTASPGYYINLNADGTNSGFFYSCSSPCNTCENTPNFCLSCVSGYALNGSACFSTYVVQNTMLMTAPDLQSSGQSYEVVYANILRFRLGFWMKFLCSIFPPAFRRFDPYCRHNFKCRGFRRGSFNLDATYDASQLGSDPASAIESSLNSNPIPGTTLLKTSSTVSGGSPATTQTNLGLILGVSIPLGILLLVIIGVIIYSKKKSAETQEIGQTDKQFQDQQQGFQNGI